MCERKNQFLVCACSDRYDWIIGNGVWWNTLKCCLHVGNSKMTSRLLSASKSKIENHDS